MRINVLQHASNEGPGLIRSWAEDYGYDMYIYHPNEFHKLPNINETDMLVILGGPMSANDDDDWIKAERKLIHEAIEKDIPIYGACFGSQQIAKALGYRISASPVKEVGWAPVYLKTNIIDDLPKKLMALHWHGEMFEVPNQAKLLFSSDLMKNQGFIMNNRIIGLQFHFEPMQTDLREIVVNDGDYASDNALNQNASDIINHSVPKENKKIMYQLLDYINQ
ncbi:type 1 glutamine amidotransferase [Apilactobacillus timberlakei]|uniref:Type 1 glutamine amidotransferase n=1 Tax=Apilactobacillus timberlakei TaxID=2008380 RepID=A0ABY2YSY0_9LACO|nr:type 1 glutamine amidotransferase [Apilactobacillus timberlakei]TPR13141.1 type 1 glutamine amidotransferase [Apilactobacillus timberlakei]TPR14191.1 type 1 glutamine amidotransferase [Apilactobacillus timberlakei]TPR16444.1 type 1 glutamine amidotransferase [Apilactobacillus timberlakei]